MFILSKNQVYHVLYLFQGARALEAYVSVLACWYAQMFISKRARTTVYFHRRMCVHECLFPNVCVYKKVSYV